MLEHKKLHDLVFVKYNQQLKQGYNATDEIDPISLNEIDVSNEWLVGEMDDDNDTGNDLVFDDDEALNWRTVCMRLQRLKRLGYILGEKQREESNHEDMMLLLLLLKNRQWVLDLQQGSKKRSNKMMRIWSLRMWNLKNMRMRFKTSCIILRRPMEKREREMLQLITMKRIILGFQKMIRVFMFALCSYAFIILLF